jgi:hypothetical protein
MPTSEPTPKEIGNVRAAILTESFETTAELIDAITDAEWLEVRKMASLFKSVEFNYSRLNGQIAGYETDTAGKRLALRNAIRTALGLPLLFDETGKLAEQNDFQGGSVPIEMVW